MFAASLTTNGALDFSGRFGILQLNEGLTATHRVALIDVDGDDPAWNLRRKLHNNFRLDRADALNRRANFTHVDFGH
jgi:hypothetical protein